EPISGVDLGTLDKGKQDRFYRLVDQTLQSPCGKAHSLRTSLTSDDSCKRAPFAAKYVVAMLEDEASDSDLIKAYEARYKQVAPKTFQLSDEVPHLGPSDAPVKLVEFFDYGCPACREFAPIVKEAVSDFPNDAVVFFKQYPLPSHPDSKPAAQAALAAAKQGKFMEMHEMLFLKSRQHKKSDLLEHAKSLGLDMTKFESDFAAAKALVEADVAEGDRVGVSATPTTFINGRPYEGPWHPRYLKMWIEEELAVNR
ncbi:MAG: thioredoxin domain-containing protein, partial [Myxococcota bacterium]